MSTPQQPSSRTHGAQVGDAVAVEMHGTVVELADRNGVPTALVELPTGHVWVPLSRVTLRRDNE